MSAEAQVTEKQVATGNEASNASGRERSTIDFPYSPLDVAVEVVRAVHATGGQKSQIEQVAAHMNESPGSGPFRAKLTTAKAFGLSHHGSGTVTLTPLGMRILDPEQEKSARAEAFLRVELYKRIYDEYKGVVLPPSNTALENAMVAMGVSPKQKDRARQAFQRSAQQAGYFAYGASKLVYPVLNAAGNEVKTAKVVEPPEDAEEKEKAAKKGGNGGGKEPPTYHPFIEGLLATLPSTGSQKTEWTLQGRQEWLQTAAGIFNLIYKAGDEDAGSSVQVSVEKPKSHYISAN